MLKLRRAVALAAIMLGATALAAHAVAPGVLRIQLTGVIDQVNAAHIEEALTTAATGGYQAALIEIDTPGGELSSMDRIVKAILASEVPVITYVAPEGAQAASAGTFVTLAGDVAGAGPSTSIGAAPGGGGAGREGGVGRGGGGGGRQCVGERGGGHGAADRRPRGNRYRRAVRRHRQR